MLGVLYVGELYTVDQENIIQNSNKVDEDLKFCPVSINGSKQSEIGYVMSKCEDDTVYTLFNFKYNEKRIVL
jgi:hypothetical protein